MCFPNKGEATRTKVSRLMWPLATHKSDPISFSLGQDDCTVYSVHQTKSSVNYKLVHDTRHTTCDSNVAYIQLLEYAIPPPRALFWIWWQFCVDFSRFFLLICLKMFLICRQFCQICPQFCLHFPRKFVGFLKKTNVSQWFSWTKSSRPEGPKAGN